MSDDTRTRMLDAAYELMISQGYAATGVGDICKRAGVSKGSFYHFFKTKQHCALEMLRHHMAEAEQIIEGGLDLAGLDGVEAALRYVEHIEQLSGELFQQGCLIGAFALELAETHPELQQEVSQIFSAITDRYEQVLAPVAAACRRSNSPTARELAEHMLTIIEGSVVLSKAHRNVGRVAEGLRMFRRYLEAICAYDSASSS